MKTTLNFEKIIEFARQNFIPIMSDATQDILKKEVQKANPKTILEIGTAIGFSGIIMLKTAKSAQLFTIDNNENSLKMAKQNFADFGVLDRVNFFVGDAREIVTQLTGKYDFIFLDGPKGQYSVFLPYLLDVLNVGGTLVCDNVLYQGLVKNIPANHHKHITIAKNLSKFLAELTSNPTLNTQIFDIADGISVSTKLRE